MFWRILKGMIDVSGITRRFKAVGGILDERSRRLVAAAESAALGRGGVSAVSRATGISRQVIRQGMAELGEAAVHPPGRVRRVGGGRKKAVTQDCLLYTSDAADDLLCVDLGGRRIIKK